RLGEGRHIFAPAVPPTGLPPNNGKTRRNATLMDSFDQIFTLTSQELRAIAHRRLAAQAPNGTLSTTALVHEAYLRLGDQSPAALRDQSHFFALASVVMRNILVDRARQRGALRH